MKKIFSILILSIMLSLTVCATEQSVLEYIDDNSVRLPSYDKSGELTVEYTVPVDTVSSRNLSSFEYSSLTFENQLSIVYYEGEPYILVFLDDSDFVYATADIDLIDESYFDDFSADNSVIIYRTFYFYTDGNLVYPLSSSASNFLDEQIVDIDNFQSRLQDDASNPRDGYGNANNGLTFILLVGAILLIIALIPTLIYLKFKKKKKNNIIYINQN